MRADDVERAVADHHRALGAERVKRGADRGDLVLVVRVEVGCRDVIEGAAKSSYQQGLGENKQLGRGDGEPVLLAQLSKHGGDAVDHGRFAQRSVAVSRVETSRSCRSLRRSFGSRAQDSGLRAGSRREHGQAGRCRPLSKLPVVSDDLIGADPERDGEVDGVVGS